MPINGPLNAIKVLIDMIRAKENFNPFLATEAALELAKTAMNTFATSSITLDASTVYAIPDEEEQRAEVALHGLMTLLPPEERQDFVPKFIIPNDVLVNIVMSWVLSQALKLIAQYGEKLSEDKKNTDEKPAENVSESPQKEEQDSSSSDSESAPGPNESTQS